MEEKVLDVKNLVLEENQIIGFLDQMEVVNLRFFYFIIYKYSIKWCIRIQWNG